MKAKREENNTVLSGRLVNFNRVTFLSRSTCMFLNFSHFHIGSLPSFSAHSRWFFELSLAVVVSDVANVEPLPFSLKLDFARSAFGSEDKKQFILNICCIIEQLTEHSESKLIQVHFVFMFSVNVLVALPRTPSEFRSST